MLQNWGNMVDGWGSGYNASCRVLNQLKFMEGFLRETKEKGVTIIDAGGDETVDKDGGGVGGEGGAKTVYAA